MPESVTRSRKLTPRILAGGAAAAVVMLPNVSAGQEDAVFELLAGGPE